MLKMMSSIRKGVPEGLEELAQLGRILWRRREYILAYFDIGAYNGPVEAINGRAEHLHGIARRGVSPFVYEADLQEVRPGVFTHAIVTKNRPFLF